MSRSQAGQFEDSVDGKLSFTARTARSDQMCRVGPSMMFLNTAWPARWTSYVRDRDSIRMRENRASGASTSLRRRGSSFALARAAATAGPSSFAPETSTSKGILSGLKKALVLKISAEAGDIVATS